MPRIYTSALSAAASEACYAAFLTGSLPTEGCFLVSGPHLFLMDSLPPLPEGRGVPVSFGPVSWIRSGISSQMQSISVYRAFLSGRRLPAGTALAAGKDGITVFPAELYEADLGKMEPFSLSFDPLEEVLTPQEAAKLYHVDAKRIQWDCEHAGESAVFSLAETRRSGNTWLLTRNAALRVYEGKEMPAYAIDPLLLVFSTVEAAHIWNRDSGVVRSAAGGAGHAAARMHEGDRRKSGRIWLVRRNGEIVELPYREKLPNNMMYELREFAGYIASGTQPEKRNRDSVITASVIEQARRQTGTLFDGE